jgi:hypothetical protein
VNHKIQRPKTLVGAIPNLIISGKTGFIIKSHSMARRA